MTETPLDAIVVGAGVAGLAAAEALRSPEAQPGQQGEAAHKILRYRILEAAAQPGGRLVSPTWHDAGFDATAQFFTARSPELKKLIASWLTKGWIKTWFAKPDEKGGEEDAYTATSGLGKLMAHWAVHHDVSCGSTVTAIEPEGTGLWKVSVSRSVFGGPKEYRSRSVLLTAPWPVSEALIAPWLTHLPESRQQKLAEIAYAPCLVLEAETQGNLNVTHPGLQFMPTPDIACIADQGQKGLSPGLVMLMSPEFSLRHAGRSESECLSLLLEKAKPWLGEARIEKTRVRYWPHARVTQAFDRPYLTIPVTSQTSENASAMPPLMVCGDGFGGPRMEGAFQSGWQAGVALAQLLRS